MEIILCSKSEFPNHKELLLKERIRSLWEQILSFKRSSNFEKGRNCRESLLDTVVFLFDVCIFSKVLVTPLHAQIVRCGCHDARYLAPIVAFLNMLTGSFVRVC